MSYHFPPTELKFPSQAKTPARPSLRPEYLHTADVDADDQWVLSCKQIIPSIIVVSHLLLLLETSSCKISWFFYRQNRIPMEVRGDRKLPETIFQFQIVIFRYRKSLSKIGLSNFWFFSFFRHDALKYRNHPWQRRTFSWRARCNGASDIFWKKTFGYHTDSSTV